ncbi:nucleic-acid-binding protein from mobile element jockey-like, partial [Vespula maculifrons]
NDPVWCHPPKRADVFCSYFKDTIASVYFPCSKEIQIEIKQNIQPIIGNNYVQQKINHITSDIRMQVDFTLQNVQPNNSKTNLSLNKEPVRLSPPVFIQTNIVYSLIKILNKSVRNTYNLKTTNQEIKIQASVINTYRQIIRTLKTRNANNYTFQLKEERRYKAKIKARTASSRHTALISFTAIGKYMIASDLNAKQTDWNSRLVTTRDLVIRNITGVLNSKLQTTNRFRDMIKPTLICNVRLKTTEDINTALEGFTLVIETHYLSSNQIHCGELSKISKEQTSIPCWNDKNGERINDLTKILKIAQSYI